MKTVALLSVLLLLACNKTESVAPAGSSSTTAASASASAAPVAAADIPSEEDFEEEAAKDITPDTLDNQLSALEKEINAE